MRRPVTVLVALAALLVAIPVAAQAPPAPVVPALELTSDDGEISAVIRGPDGAVATVAERVDGRLEAPAGPVTIAEGAAEVAPLAPWRCDRTLRRFEATIAAPGAAPVTAAAAVRTPSCARRLQVSRVPSRLRTGAELTLRIEDTWDAGVRARVCVDPPAGRTRCRLVDVPDDGEEARITRRLQATGVWRIGISAMNGAVKVRRSVRVVPPAHLRLLATGDSMIQTVDHALDRRLPRATVRSDARISTGISKPQMLDWVAHARRQAASFRPEATVVFLGANDGFPIGAAGCCGDAWIDAYARRVREMMEAYRRGGAGRVYWMTLPTPGKPTFARVFRAVNAAVRRAARRAGSGVRVIDVSAAVAPNGYARSIRRGGRTVVVRQDDQVHLSLAGADIAAALVVDALRRDGLV